MRRIGARFAPIRRTGFALLGNLVAAGHQVGATL